MYADITKPPAPPPLREVTVISLGILLLRPLSRRGSGPGLILVTENSENIFKIADGVPSVFMKWAEEGYAVVQISVADLQTGRRLGDAVAQAATILERCEKCLDGNFGLIAYSGSLWNEASTAFPAVSKISAGIIYLDASEVSSIAKADFPVLQHICGPAAKVEEEASSIVQYYYPKTTSRAFAIPWHEHFHYITESISHTRSLQFLKPKLNGPFFDLEKIWEEHTYYEFADRSVEHTMSTMVQEPYVNHIPTLTGGIGQHKLSAFYRHNFIFNNSQDTDLDLVSRTIGIDRVVDEFIFSFTHDREIDWLLPGVPPTHRKAHVPFTAVVNIRGDRLYHEHISWDQGTLLRQLGLMPEYLPFPYPVEGDKDSTAGGAIEYRVPVAGIETANKVLDRHAVPSNEMFAFKPRARE